MTDRLSPYDEKTEAAALGAMLLSPKEAVSDFVATYPQPERLFYDIRHQRIFGILMAMVGAGQHVDSVTLALAVKTQKAETECGGIGYVSGLPDCAPSTYELPTYGAKLQELQVRRAMIATGARITAAGYDAENALESLDECEKELFAIRNDSMAGGETSIRTLVRGAIDEMEAAQANVGRLRGIATGFPRLDRMTRGMRPGQLIVLAARPGEGKTSLAMNIAEHVAVDGKIPVGVFSLEMTKAELVYRMLCSRARVPSDTAETQMDEREMHRMTMASGAIAKSPLHICDQGGLSLAQIRARARRMVSRHGAKLIIVDYLGLISSKGKSLYERVSEVSAGLKQLAKELSVPLIVPCQMNREHDKEKSRKPRLSDLRDSGSVEQDADIVAFIHHAENGCTLNIEKQRNGPTGLIPLTFHRGITRFEERGMA